MKITDFIFRFKTYNFFSSVGICRVRVFVNSKSEVYVMMTELDENYSTSVTNAVELIYQQLLDLAKIPENSQVIEHYPDTFYGGETFSRVIFDENGNPEWKGMSFSRVLDVLECGQDEFDDYKKDERVQKEIYNALNGLPDIKRYEYTEPPQITERRLEISLNQHTKSELKALLETRPSERKLSEFLKEDLSMLGEFYSYVKDEYICFCEFPVGKGRVDFAVFTGRSRMSVYLIEIKGAQKNLCRKNHYKTFVSSVQDGRSQLNERADWIRSNYETYRKFVHTVLADVKNGKRPYNAFTSPKYKLEVDPNKDVKFFYVLIAERTQDDLTDSHKRHVEDLSSGLNIQTETWDSWCNKLERD